MDIILNQPRKFVLILSDRGVSMKKFYNFLSRKNEKNNDIVSYEQIHTWLKNIGENKPCLNNKDEILFDYEVASIIQDFLSCDGKIIVKNPFIIFRNQDIGLCDIKSKLHLEEGFTIIDSTEILFDCRTILDKTLSHQSKDDFTHQMLNFIFDYGDRENVSADMEEFDILCEMMYNLLNFEDIDVVLDIEDGVIAIAFNDYIDNAKDVIGYRLGLSPKCFIEVSGPWSTVLLIDCQKIFASTQYYNLEDKTWYY